MHSNLVAFAKVISGTSLVPYFIAKNRMGMFSLSALSVALGLNNVDNTSDANKPVSTAQQTALNSKANLAGATFTGAVIPTPSALTDAANIATNAALANVFSVILNGNRTLDNPSNPVAGQQIIWHVTQGAGGSHTLAYGAAFAWPGGIVPILSTTAGAVDLISGVYLGTRWHCTFALNLA